MRYAVVQSDSEEDVHMAEEEEVYMAEEEVYMEHEQVVEALEFAIRNVPLHGNHLLEANEALANLRTRSTVLFHQALSPRWSLAFVRVLKRARMARVVFTEQFTNECVLCGSHHTCQVALELIAGSQSSLGSHGVQDIADGFDRQIERDVQLFKSYDERAYLGVYAGGRRCFDLAIAAVVARNLLQDTCYEIFNVLYLLQFRY